MLARPLRSLVGCAAAMMRWLAAGCVLAALAGLFIWQWSRERRIQACVAAGGVWDGPQSRCLQSPPSPILRRNLERT